MITNSYLKWVISPQTPLLIMKAISLNQLFILIKVSIQIPLLLTPLMTYPLEEKNSNFHNIPKTDKSNHHLKSQSNLVPQSQPKKFNLRIIKKMKEILKKKNKFKTLKINLSRKVRTKILPLETQWFLMKCLLVGRNSISLNFLSNHLSNQKNLSSLNLKKRSL